MECIYSKEEADVFVLKRTCFKCTIGGITTLRGMYQIV